MVRPVEKISSGKVIDFNDIDKIVSETGTSPKDVIPILSAIQKRYNYLPEEAMRRVCEITEITPASITGVASFYSSFRFSPAGRHLIKVCTGTACHVKGASRVKDAILRFLNVEEGKDSDDRGMFTVTEVACLGCCTLAPAVQIDDITYGHLSPGNVGDMIDDFIEKQQERTADKKVTDVCKPEDRDMICGEVRVGLGSCCIAGGSSGVMESIEEEIRRSRAPVRLKRVGCVGMCHQTPLVEVINRDGKSTLYSKVKADQAAGIVREHFKSPSLYRRTESRIDHFLDQLLTGGKMPSVTSYSIDIRDKPVEEFLGKQKHIATANCGNMDPLDIDEYISNEGFSALRKVLQEKNPGKVIEMISDSGLRGRGGAGFPTGKKLDIVHKAAGNEKYVIMNGDEGDPGAFMDRMLLESFPFRVIEGIIIAAYCVGAEKGELYIRREYPLALRRIREALQKISERGYLGKNILGSGFDFEIHIMEGAGAFVCGEETALLESIEGKRGFPRTRPPYPALKGLWGKPTLVNNVETYACVAWIVREGAEAFAALGTEKSRGTKVFSLAGKIARGGLIEVPMGITINEIINEIGGGIQNGRKFKAVQIGGPSGGCIPAELADTPVDFEKLTAAGAIMGSGGLVVLDDSDCMVDVAKYFLEFTQAQSCGKCTFCRIGTKRMLEILSRLCEGKGRTGDIESLEHLANITKQGSTCGLGQTAPNPVLSTLKYFRSEYEAHIKGICPAMKCAKLIRYFISTECIGCTKCAQICPVEAIQINPHQRHEIDNEKCIRCDSCRGICSVKAVKIRTGT